MEFDRLYNKYTLYFDNCPKTSVIYTCTGRNDKWKIYV